MSADIIKLEITMVTGYCVKCKQKDTELKNAKMYKTSKGGFMAKGTHDKCGTTVCAMMSKVNAEEAMKNGVPKAF